MKTSLKLLSVILASFASWLTTSALLAHMRANPAPESEPSGSETVLTQIAQPAPPPETAEAAQARFDALDEKPIAMTSLDAYDVDVAQGKATVAAKVSMSETRPGFAYIWRLRILDPRTKIVSNRYYDHQIFRMEADGFMQPTFKDVIALPSGRSYVQLSLFAFPEGTERAALDDDGTAETFRILRGVKNVSN